MLSQDAIDKAPAWVRWIAPDMDGTWWGFEAEPNEGSDSWYENIALILVNAALLDLETWPTAMPVYRPLISALGRAILTVFVVDITLRLYAQRAAFWRNPCVVGSCQHFQEQVNDTEHALLARLRDLRPGSGTRPAGAIRRHPYR
jgi:hypothetical protein